MACKFSVSPAQIHRNGFNAFCTILVISVSVHSAPDNIGSCKCSCDRSYNFLDLQSHPAQYCRRHKYHITFLEQDIFGCVTMCHHAIVIQLEDSRSDILIFRRSYYLDALDPGHRIGSPWQTRNPDCLAMAEYQIHLLCGSQSATNASWKLSMLMMECWVFLKYSVCSLRVRARQNNG